MLAMQLIFVGFLFIHIALRIFTDHALFLFFQIGFFIGKDFLVLGFQTLFFSLDDGLFLLNFLLAHVFNPFVLLTQVLS